MIAPQVLEAAPEVPAPSLVLSVCGDSRAGVNASWRAAMIARDLRASLQILHPVPRQGAVVRKPVNVRELAEEIARRTGIQVAVEAVSDSLLRGAVSASGEAALLVLPSHRSNPLREWIMGTPAERLIRMCRCPVLVVKRAAVACYQRVLVCVDFDDQAERLVRLGVSLGSGTKPEVVHVLADDDEQVSHPLTASSQALQGLRQHHAARAYLGIHETISAARLGAGEAVARVDFGGVSRVVLKRACESDAELLVLGKRQRGLLADYFLGGTTQRVLEKASADVLVYPARPARIQVLAAQDAQRWGGPSAARAG
jgi:nucleotide-binding universal stress UspA family protein